MPELYLIIADRPLCAAISEQLKLAPWDDVQLHESLNLPASFAARPAALLIDAPLADRKSLKILRDGCGNDDPPKIFVLGEVNLNDGPVTESFSKPLRLGHMLARLQFHLQSVRMKGERFPFGPFCLEPAARRIVVRDTEATIRLTEKETHLLEYLGRSQKPVAREELLAAIWGYDARIDTHTLETHVYQLRRKLDPFTAGAKFIVAEQGAYWLAAPP